MKYILCKPQGGFCDNLQFIDGCIKYCKKYNRILLINMLHSWTYKINFSDYFYFNDSLDINVITDINNINKILSDKSKTVYPHFLKDNITYFKSIYSKERYYYWSKDPLKRPINININTDYQEDIIIYENCATNHNGNALNLFKLLEFKDNLLIDFYKKYNNIKKPYVCIQIRNSDRNCNYQKLYEENKDIIKKYNIVIATDDKLSLEFFKNKGLNISNFTTFPNNIRKNQGLHYSSLDPDVKIKDTISDLLIISLADIILSNSNGSYITLAKILNDDKNIVLKKLKKVESNKVITINQKKNKTDLLKLIRSRKI